MIYFQTYYRQQFLVKPRLSRQLLERSCKEPRERSAAYEAAENRRLLSDHIGEVKRYGELSDERL